MPRAAPMSAIVVDRYPDWANRRRAAALIASPSTSVREANVVADGRPGARRSDMGGIVRLLAVIRETQFSLSIDLYPTTLLPCQLTAISYLTGHQSRLD